MFGKTHAIERIGEQALVIDGSLEPLIDRAAPLTEYVWRFRYPGDPEPPSRAEVMAALEVATELHEGLLARLPGEVRPGWGES